MNLTTLPFLFILMYSNIYAKSTSFILPYTLINQHCFIELNLSLKGQCKLCLVDQHTPYTWFNALFISSIDESNKLSNDSIELSFYPNTTFNAELYHEQLLINKTKLELQYYYIHNIDNNGLSLSYNIDKKEFSLIHLLYSQHYVNKLMYSIIPTNMFQGKFLFGEAPSISTKSNKEISKGECKVMNNKWSCFISGVSINDQHTYYCGNTINETNFQVKEKETYSSFMFLDYVARSLNHINKQQKRCKVKQNQMKNYYYIECDSHELVFGKNITFNIGDYLFTTSISTFFNFDEEKPKSTLVSSTDKCLEITDNKNKNCWIFGTNFLLNYISTFDYEKSTITFISRSQLNSINRKCYPSINQGRKYIKKLFISVIGMMFVNTVLLMFIKFF